MTPPIPMDCSNPDCEYSTPGNIPSFELILKALELHVRTAHSEYSGKASNKVEKLKRPIITVNMSESDWTFYEHKWTRYRRQAALTGQNLLDELWACLDGEIERLAFQAGIASTDASDLMKQIKALAVTSIHPSMHVVALHQLKQHEGESAKAFCARVRGTAVNCNLEKTGTRNTCDEKISFLEETCYHVAMTGLIHEDLKEKVLTQAMLGVVKDLQSLIDFATAEEASRHRQPLKEIAAIQNKPQPAQPKQCHYCGLQSHGQYNKQRSKQCPAFGKKCSKCGRNNHFANVCRSSRTAAINVDQDENSEEPSVSEFVTAILPTLKITSVDSAKPAVQALRMEQNSVTTLPVPHHIFCQQTKHWKRSPPKSPPTVELSVMVDKAAYAELNLLPPELTKKQGAGFARARKGTADTGAQLTVVNEQELAALGVKKHSIFPLAMSVNSVTKTPID